MADCFLVGANLGSAAQEKHLLSWAKHLADFSSKIIVLSECSSLIPPVPGFNFITGVPNSVNKNYVPSSHAMEYLSRLKYSPPVTPLSFDDYNPKTGVSPLGVAI